MSVFFRRRGPAPVLGKLASDYAVGESVFLNIGGVAKEFVVVHQGKPSSIYDDSCNGTWLLMKNIYEARQWHSSNVNDYANSTIHSYLNSTFLGLFDADVQSGIKRVKIPYVNGTGSTGSVKTGSSGLSARIFLLSAREVGFYSAYNETWPDCGAKLDYFESGFGDSACKKRWTYFNDDPYWYWSLRCPLTVNNTQAWAVGSGDTFYAYNQYDCTTAAGIRPALVLSSNAKFDPDTNKLIAV